MKKKYLTNTFTALLLAVSLKVSAQALNGNYTINSAQATSGSNFQTFTDFATAINTNGVAGPVTVNVDPGSGPYNEQVTFTSITGASSANRVVINGNGRLLYYSATSNAAPHTLLLNGTDFMTVNELNIQGQGSNYAMVCVLSSGANYNNFNGCTFEAPLNGTASYQVPFAITGNPTSPTSAGGGEYNTVTTCTMMNGYYGITAYGLSSAPYTQGNSFIGCRVTDFYYYGMYFMYAKNMTIRNCIFDRATRTTASSVRGWYCYYNQGGLFEGNRFEKFFAGMNNPSTTCYVIYGYGNPIQNGQRNVYRNNIVTDMHTNGTIYGMYVPYSGSDIYNNTLNFDYANATSANTIYGIYGYGNAGLENNIINNLITIRRGASGGNRYPIYLAVSGNVTVDYNNIDVLNAGGNDNHGYYNGVHSTLASWQSAGMDANGNDLDPVYTSSVDLHPTNTSLNNLGQDLNILFDQQGAIRHPSTPDIGALEFLTPICAGTPSMTVAGPSFSVCPGETADFSIGNLSSDLGYTYQWQWSTTSVVGPFTITPGANSITHSVPNVTTTTWVSAIITCTAPGGGTITPVVQVDVSPTTTNTVPYFEGFEGIGLNNRLPNCSWLAPTMGLGAKTYTAAAGGNLIPNNGNAFAAFMNAGAGVNYYHTNGIWLDAGVTYSASLWYQTDMNGSTNWTDLSILYGAAQTATGLTQIASVSPAVSPFYKALTNTFSVPNSGLYYVAVRATNSAGGAQSLTWDDLSIIIPCTPSLNTPTVNLSVSNSTVCSGEPVILTAAGADTYTWSTGANGSAITEYPQVTTTYYVNGSSALTGCSGMVSQIVVVKPSPNVAVFALPPAVCAGKSTNLQASGAMTYTWSNGSQGGNVNVVPTGNTSYAVMGTGSNGCVASSSVAVTVNPLPNVQATASNLQICKDDELTFTGTGATSYEWTSNNPAMVLLGSPVVFYLNSSATFTVTGTDANGCQNTQLLSISVDACTGIGELSGSGALNVYPNPTSGQLTVDFGGAGGQVTVTDVTGRIITVAETEGYTLGIDLSSNAAGVYYVKVESGESLRVVKVIRQ
jgi:hypothetical protein